MASVPAATTVVTVRLSRDNHLMWKAQFLTFLRTYNLLGIASGGEMAPAPTVEQTTGTGEGRTTTQVENPEYTIWYRKDQTILGGILATVSEDILP